MRHAVLAALLLSGACVPYPGELPQEDRGSSLPAITDGGYPGLDPGANETQSLHFVVKAYGSDPARTVSDQAEAAYGRIMTDTGLYSFRPRELYRIVVYGSQDEYRKKTGQPDWSGGLAVGNALYLYLSPRLPPVLSHEMTHLIWYEYMRGRLPQEHRWINEGLAVYEEFKAAAPLGTGGMFQQLLPMLKAQPISMDQMQRLVPASERAYDVSLWYAQSESMVRFMIERGGRIGFGQFLAALRDGQTLDGAVAAGFPGQWRTLAELEADWRRGLQ